MDLFFCLHISYFYQTPPPNGGITDPGRLYPMHCTVNSTLHPGQAPDWDIGFVTLFSNTYRSFQVPLAMSHRKYHIPVRQIQCTIENPAYGRHRISRPTQHFKKCNIFRDNKRTVFAEIVLYLNNPFGI